MTVITTILALLIIPIPLKQIQAGGYGIFSLFRKPRFFYKRTAMLFVTSLLFVGLYFTGRRFSYSLVFSATYFAFYALFSFVSVCAVISGKVKNPPVYTNRLTRLYVLSGLFGNFIGRCRAVFNARSPIFIVCGMRAVRGGFCDGDCKRSSEPV